MDIKIYTTNISSTKVSNGGGVNEFIRTVLNTHLTGENEHGAILISQLKDMVHERFGIDEHQSRVRVYNFLHNSSEFEKVYVPGGKSTSAVRRKVR